MILGKSKQFRKYKSKNILDQILWIIENYLPQKKNRLKTKELSLDTIEVETIKQIQKLVSLRSKSISPKTTERKISFTFGSWALPYLKLLKKLGLAK
tara:strand:+ start:688 stop:978 length:291 start_codon:yes stop_codon:yes gene_type:complete